MIDALAQWLLAPIDPLRAHEVGFTVSWHGRLMVLGWGVLFPLGIVVARFAKRLPWQDWPRQLDSKVWWHSHLMFQYAGGVAVVGALALILTRPAGVVGDLHSLVGWSVLVVMAMQFLAGWFRGTKGGPTAAQMAGDHYDMTPRRKAFEYWHKSVGYVAIMVAVAAILTGLWLANGPRWMWIALLLWWACLVMVFWRLQRRGLAFDTYQAIWGPDPTHPGNRMRPIGWGVRREDAG